MKKLIIVVLLLFAGSSHAQDIFGRGIQSQSTGPQFPLRYMVLLSQFGDFAPTVASTISNTAGLTLDSIWRIGEGDFGASFTTSYTLDDSRAAVSNRIVGDSFGGTHGIVVYNSAQLMNNKNVRFRTYLWTDLTTPVDGVLIGSRDSILELIIYSQ